MLSCGGDVVLFIVFVDFFLCVFGMRIGEVIFLCLIYLCVLFVCGCYICCVMKNLCEKCMFVLCGCVFEFLVNLC